MWWPSKTQKQTQDFKQNSSKIIKEKKVTARNSKTFTEHQENNLTDLDEMQPLGYKRNNKVTIEKIVMEQKDFYQNTSFIEFADI